MNRHQRRKLRAIKPSKDGTVPPLNVETRKVTKYISQMKGHFIRDRFQRYLLMLNKNERET
jgi:hypothetical protein